MAGNTHVELEAIADRAAREISERGFVILPAGIDLRIIDSGAVRHTIELADRAARSTTRAVRRATRSKGAGA